MESKKINQLATNLAPVSTDLTVVGNPTTGELKKITLLQISSLFGGITSIGMVVPSGFSVSPSTLTASGTFTITGAGTTAQYIRGDGSLATFPTFLSSDKLIQEVRNNSGATMLKGSIVYINGAVGNKATIAKALATSDATSAQTYGVVQDDISNNSNGYVVVVGEVTGLDTSAVTEGQQLYLSGTTAGYYTVTKPYAPTHLVYVAIVLRSHPTQGILGVKIQNGYEMDELHNVDAVSPSNNDGLFYNTTTSLWEHKPITTALGYTPVPYSGATGSVVLGTNNISANTFQVKENTAGTYYYSSGFSSINASANYFAFAKSSTQIVSFYYPATQQSYTLPAGSGTLALTTDIVNQTITLSGDVSGSGTTAITTAIGTNKVTNAMLAQIATTSFLGRVTAGTGNVETLTGTQATTLLDVFSSTLKGLVPLSGGGTTNFLRADGTWAAAGSMAIGGSITSATANSVLFAGTSGVLAQDNTNFFWDNTSKILNIKNSTAGYGLIITKPNSYINLVSTVVSGLGDASYIFQTYDGSAITDVGNFGGTNSTFSYQDYGARATYLKGVGVGGLALMATNSTTSNIRFYLGGDATTNKKMHLYSTGNLVIQNGGTFTDAGYKLDVVGTARLQDNLTISDAKNIILATTTGTKIGTATSQKLSFWNATPIVQPTTAAAAATFVTNTSLIANDTATFDGYTIGQVVKALRNAGLLA